MPVESVGNICGSLTRMGVDALAADRALFRMSFGFNIEPLAASISEVGLLNPPIVWQEEGGVHVVAGYRRVLALLETGCSTVECVVLPSSDSRDRCLLLNFYDNLATRELNPVEKAMACSRLASLFPRREVISRFMPAMGLPSDESTLDFYAAMDTDLDDEIKHAVASGQMSVKAVKPLLRLPPGERRAFCDLLEKMKFNNNQQLQVFDLISDISIRDRKASSVVLGDEDLRAIVEAEAMNPPQKARAFLDCCRRKRYPSIHAAERSFKSRVGALGLPAEVGIIDPECFEASGFRMQVKFEDGCHLRDTLDQILRLPLETLTPPWKDNPDAD